jgi:hypothetical protein
MVDLPRVLFSSRMKAFARLLSTPRIHRTATKVSPLHFIYPYVSRLMKFPQIDQQSSYTSFEGVNNPPASGHIVHSVKGTQIDQSEVYNGDVSSTQDLRVRREHTLEGGSIKNRSKVANGDLNIDAFVAFYCRQPEPTTEYRAEPQSAHRAGPRHGPTPRRQSRK